MMVTQDVGILRIGSQKVGPFKKGNSYSIPLWQANILREFNVAEMGEGNSLGCADIQKQVTLESSIQKLGALPKNFFFNARCEEEVLLSHIRGNIKPKDMGRRFSSYIYDLLQVRLSKLLKLATTTPTKTARRDLPEEEQMLLDRLAKIIDEWTSFFLKSHARSD